MHFAADHFLAVAKRSDKFAQKAAGSAAAVDGGELLLIGGHREPRSQLLPY